MYRNLIAFHRALMPCSRRARYPVKPAVELGARRESASRFHYIFNALARPGVVEIDIQERWRPQPFITHI